MTSKVHFTLYIIIQYTLPFVLIIPASIYISRNPALIFLLYAIGVLVPPILFKYVFQAKCSECDSKSMTPNPKPETKTWIEYKCKKCEHNLKTVERGEFPAYLAVLIGIAVFICFICLFIRLFVAFYLN